MMPIHVMSSMSAFGRRVLFAFSHTLSVVGITAFLSHCALRAAHLLPVRASLSSSSARFVSALARSIVSQRSRLMSTSSTSWGVADDSALRSAPIVFVTDTEGNFASFLRALRPSSLPDWQFVNADGVPARAFRLIFGGDATSRGKEDLKLLRHLDALSTHPLCRVRKLIGNRDAMFFRLPDALHPVRLVSALHEKSVYFVPVTTFNLPEQEILAHAKCDNDELRAIDLAELRQRGRDLLDSLNDRPSEWSSLQSHPVFVALAAARLRTLTKCTMGSPNSFDLRRAELSEQQSSVSDADVLHSFRQSLQPGGELLKYCQAAEIAIVDNGCVFVHGSLSGEIITHVQGRPFTPQPDQSHITQWLAAYNAATQSSLHQYSQNYANHQTELFQQYFAGTLPAQWEEAGGYGFSPIHDFILASMMTSSHNPTSPIYSSFAAFYAPDANMVLDDTLQSALAEASIHSIACGHNPHGDGVVSLRFECADRLVRVHCADNSYAANVKFAEPNGVAAVPFAPNSPRSLARGSDPRGRLSATSAVFEAQQHWLIGSLSNGLTYCNRIVTANDTDSNEISRLSGQWIGTKVNVADKSLLIKHVLPDGTFVAALSEKWDITNYRIRPIADGQFEVMPWSELLADAKL